VDSTITGTLSGDRKSTSELQSHIYALPLGWSHVMHAVNVKTWDKLPAPVKTFLQAEIASLEDRIWKAAAEETDQGYDCNAGKDNCTMGTKAKMTVVPVSEADKALLKKVMAETVVPKWAARCAGDCVPAWNDSIGKIVGITAKAN